MKKLIVLTMLIFMVFPYEIKYKVLSKDLKSRTKKFEVLLSQPLNKTIDLYYVYNAVRSTIKGKVDNIRIDVFLFKDRESKGWYDRHKNVKWAVIYEDLISKDINLKIEGYTKEQSLNNRKEIFKKYGKNNVLAIFNDYGYGDTDRPKYLTLYKKGEDYYLNENKVFFVREGSKEIMKPVYSWNFGTLIYNRKENQLSVYSDNGEDWQHEYRRSYPEVTYKVNWKTIKIPK